jgi:hypothetical protein
MVQTPELFQMAALWPVLKKYYNHCKWRSCGLYYKRFTILIYDRNDSMIVIYNCNNITIVIYDRNESGQYYKSINYDSSIVNKWRHKLERTLQS